MGETGMEYLVPYAAYAEDQFVEKRSRFIGRLWRVESPEEAMDRIREMRETYRDATHHCYAYILREGNFMRYSDDGEPQGTAGMPILEVLRHKELVNVLCVVTRYFGGVLLGTGGLVRAYTEGAKIAVAAAGIMRMTRCAVLLIACPYALLGAVQQVLPTCGCTVEEIDYGADVTLTVIQPEGGAEQLNRALADATAGTVSAEVMEVRFMGQRVDLQAE